MAKAKSNRRELLQLADTFDPNKHNIAGFYISEKLDGTRCFWDGGLSRGMKTEDVPYASVVDPKTGKKKAKIKPYATGLWSRYGNPIIAPDWFLNCLPACPLDGELWAGRGKFQLCRSICGGDDPDPRFDQIQYAVYSSPALPYVFAEGEIKNANMVATFNGEQIDKWVNKRLELFDGYRAVFSPATFDNELMFLRELLQVADDRVFMHKQVRLPEDETQARFFVNDFLERTLEVGGEGVVIRDPSTSWTPKRHKGLLKFKPFEDAEAVIVGYVAGKEGKQGQVRGKIGALKVRAISNELNGVDFEIGSGLKMHEREFAHQADIDWATDFPGEPMPSHANGKFIRLGDTITFKYRELTDDGIPKEGRFWRKRDVE
jgi:DNA ligase-1